jgi:hypothetical protein
MEMLLTLMTEDLDPVLGALFEGVVADALVTTDMIKDLIGPQANLAQSLCSLADFLHGRGDVKRMTPNLARIGALIERGAGESCRLILVERLLAELKRDHPLDRKCPEADGALLDSVVEHLRGPTGWSVSVRRSCAISAWSRSRTSCPASGSPTSPEGRETRRAAALRRGAASTINAVSATAGPSMS